MQTGIEVVSRASW